MCKGTTRMVMAHEKLLRGGKPPSPQSAPSVACTVSCVGPPPPSPARCTSSVTSSPTLSRSSALTRSGAVLMDVRFTCGQQHRGPQECTGCFRLWPRHNATQRTQQRQHLQDHVAGEDAREPAPRGQQAGLVGGAAGRDGLDQRALGHLQPGRHRVSRHLPHGPQGGEQADSPAMNGGAPARSAGGPDACCVGGKCMRSLLDRGARGAWTTRCARRQPRYARHRARTRRSSTAD